METNRIQSKPTHGAPMCENPLVCMCTYDDDDECHLVHVCANLVPLDAGPFLRDSVHVHSYR